MVDNLTKEKRSKIMRSIRSKDTKPELLVRKILTGLGYRYRLHTKHLPGRPDIAFIGKKKAIFIHGCFWHSHANCPIAKVPENDFWKEKLGRNQARDLKALNALEASGWSVLTLWECSLKNTEQTTITLNNFLKVENAV
ncbi:MULTISPECIES: very short patch repair endonuclease [unclassified Methylophilus]|uniref:very short patch repair endonuclease n=1 Tax=unclassified Methylophilus TaxID=2630143 RepID=UPI00035D79F3|nr:MULTISPECIES: very short patch repair endonuclease [unclassified Methylophilus]